MKLFHRKKTKQINKNTMKEVKIKIKKQHDEEGYTLIPINIMKSTSYKDQAFAKFRRHI